MDFKSHLQRQIEFLKRSAASYDNGATDEAIRLAVTIRVLLHQTPKSTSLLTHLKGTGIKLLSTSEGAGPKAFHFQSLYMNRVQMTEHGPVGKLLPCLDSGPINRFISAADWWNQIVQVQGHKRVSRKDIVLCAANKDGGAHVDEKLTTEYEKMSQDGYAGHLIYGYGEVSEMIPFVDAHFASIRQMAYELLNSPEFLAIAV